MQNLKTALNPKSFKNTPSLNNRETVMTRHCVCFKMICLLPLFEIDAPCLHSVMHALDKVK